MIKRRLYFLLPDSEHTKVVVNDLLNADIDKRQIHAIAGHGVDPDRLPVETKRLSPDNGARIESILWSGSLVLFFIALISFIVLLMSQTGGYWWLIPVSIMMLTFVAGRVFVTRIPNVHLAEFQDAMRHHEILLIIDLPYRQILEIEDLVHKLHPEAIVSGVGWSPGTLQF